LKVNGLCILERGLTVFRIFSIIYIEIAIDIDIDIAIATAIAIAIEIDFCH